MALQAAIKDATRRGQRITIKTRGGGVLDLSGASTVTGVLQEKRPGGTSRAITGTLSVETPATAGIILWEYSAADVAEEGYFWVQFTIQYGDGKNESTFVEAWEVAKKL